MSELHTFIPAGGLGTRLHPHTASTPKPLLPMGNGQRIIDHPLDLCGEISSHTWVSTDYLGEQVEAYLADTPGVSICRDTGTVGSGGSLLLHYDQFSGLGQDDDMLVLPSDHIYEGIDLARFQRTHRETGADITLLTVPNKPHGEYVELTEDSPTCISKLPADTTVSTTGIFIFRNRYLMDKVREARAQERKTFNIYSDIVCPAVGSVAVSHHFIDESTGFWEDTGTLQRYHESNMRLSGNENVVAAGARIADESRVKRCVVIGPVELGSAEPWKDCIVTATEQGQLLVSQL